MSIELELHALQGADSTATGETQKARFHHLPQVIANAGKTSMKWAFVI
jgi:hypothetical protein